MDMKALKKQAILSGVILLLFAIICIWFSYRFGIYQYAARTEDNTSIARGTVESVYTSTTRRGHSRTLYVGMTSGENLILSHGFTMSSFKNETGYDLAQLRALLEGNEITYLRMDRVPWIVKIYIGDTVIDNTKLTDTDLTTSRWGVPILSSLLLIAAIIWDICHFRKKYAQMERKRRKKERRRAKLAQKNQK